MSKSANKILMTAEQLFNQHSFNAVGVDLIRDQSGCSKTTLYTHFNNKQQLVLAVLQQRDQRFRQELQHYVGQQLEREALEAIFDWHMQWFQRDDFKGCLFVRAVAESSGHDQHIIETARAHKLWLRGLIEQHCQNFQHAAAISQLSYHLLEGLISRFLVEGYTAEVAFNAKKSMLQFIALSNMTSAIPSNEREQLT